MGRPFLYRCPVTGMNAQGLTSDDASSDSEKNRLQVVECLACGGFHLVDPWKGPLLHPIVFRGETIVHRLEGRAMTGLKSLDDSGAQSPPRRSGRRWLFAISSRAKGQGTEFLRSCFTMFARLADKDTLRCVRVPASA